MKQRKNQNLQYKDMFNNLIEVSKVNPDMTEEIMYKTAVQFFTDGYDSAALESFLYSILTEISIIFPFRLCVYVFTI